MRAKRTEDVLKLVKQLLWQNKNDLVLIDFYFSFLWNISLVHKFFSGQVRTIINPLNLIFSIISKSKSIPLEFLKCYLDVMKIMTEKNKYEIQEVEELAAIVNQIIGDLSSNGVMEQHLIVLC